MKRGIFFSLFVLACIGSANAADLPRKAAAAPPASSPFAGFYVGIHGGVGWANQRYDFVTVPGIVTGNVYPAGAMLGATIGFGGTAGAAWLGAEADFDYDFTRASSGCGIAGTCSTKNSAFLTQGIVFGAPLTAITAAIPQPAVTPPSQWPIPLNVPSNLSMATIMPAIKVGIAERSVSACATPIAGDNTECASRWMAGPYAALQLRIAVAQNVTAKAEAGYAWFGQSWTSPNGSLVFGQAQFKSLGEGIARLGVDFHL